MDADDDDDDDDDGDDDDDANDAGRRLCPKSNLNYPGGEFRRQTSLGKISTYYYYTTTPSSSLYPPPLGV